MSDKILTRSEIGALVKPVAQRYGIQAIYLFGSYARGEAGADSDLDFLVYGGEGFRRTRVFALAEELRRVFQKAVDVFEIHEVNMDSDFYKTIMAEKVFVA